MSLYREAHRRRLWPVVLAAALAGAIGLAVGLLIGGSDEEVTIAEATLELREEVQPALASLELVEIEYSEALKDGDVVAETEYEAAATHADEAEGVFEAAIADLQVLDPAATERASVSLARLGRLIEERADGEVVTDEVQTARSAISTAARVETTKAPQ